MVKIKKSKKVCFIVSEKVFKSAVTFYIGYPWKEFYDKVEKLRLESEKPLDPRHENANGLAVGIKNKGNQDCFVVWMPFFTWNIKLLAVLSHELIHITGYIMENKQIPIRMENDEVYAYLHEYYFTETLKKLNPKK